MSHILDTRDLIAEHDELLAMEDLDGDDQARATMIAELLEELGPEAGYGMPLIPVEVFDDYARELAEDIGAIPTEYTWPASCIDWPKAARELAMDYRLVTFDGVDYYARP